jgi:chromosome segregation ATPase
MREKQEIEN